MQQDAGRLAEIEQGQTRRAPEQLGLRLGKGSLELVEGLRLT